MISSVIHVLFSVLLGAVASSMVKVDVAGAVNCASAINKDNIYRVTLFIILYFIEWIAFSVAFPLSQGASDGGVSISGIMLFCYAPALFVLTYTMLLSLDCGHDILPSFAIYSMLALVIEVSVIYFRQTIGVGPRVIEYSPPLVLAVMILIRVGPVIAFSSGKGWVSAPIYCVLAAIVCKSIFIAVLL